MVSTDVSGLVKDVDVREGEHVKKGQILFRLDPKPFQIAHLQCASCVKPGSPMPHFDALPPEDLKALATFLEASKGTK